jgi:hypothetical protein
MGGPACSTTLAADAALARCIPADLLARSGREPSESRSTSRSPGPESPDVVPGTGTSAVDSKLLKITITDAANAFVSVGGRGCFRQLGWPAGPARFLTRRSLHQEPCDGRPAGGFRPLGHGGAKGGRMGNFKLKDRGPQLSRKSALRSLLQLRASTRPLPVAARPEAGPLAIRTGRHCQWHPGRQSRRSGQATQLPGQVSLMHMIGGSLSVTCHCDPTASGSLSERPMPIAAAQPGQPGPSRELHPSELRLRELRVAAGT